jgi:hypothetical protein
MAMLLFLCTILLMSVRTGYMVGDANSMEKRVEPLIFTSPIGLHRKIFTVKHPFNKTLKFFKELKHLGFMTEKIDPCKSTKIIDESDIIFLMTKGINGRSLHIRKHKLQWSSRMTTRQRIRKLVSLGTKAGITHRLL